MSVENLKKRYMHISKQSLSFLKEEEFKKKGNMYYKEKKDLTLCIGAYVPRSWMNHENSYNFKVVCRITSIEDELIMLHSFIEKKKNVKEVFITGICLFDIDLNKNDTLTGDDGLIDKIRVAIKNDLLPKIKKISCIDDLILVGESELHLPKEERFFFPLSIYSNLALLCAFKGFKEKTLEMCENFIESIPQTSRHLAEEDARRYIQYFEQKGL